MTSYSNLEDLANGYNLTGALSGTSTIPGITLDSDEHDRKIITFTHFRSNIDIDAADYYDTSDNEYLNIASTYRNDIETAINSILNPTSNYAVVFSNVANISFQEADEDTGIITFAQMNGAFTEFGTNLTSAGSYHYPNSLADPEDRYGDIWLNMDNDGSPLPGFGVNVWTADSSIVPGTRAYTILMEEISHSLGIDIYDPLNVARNADIDNQKYTVTSYHSHSDMQYEDIVTLGITEGIDVYGPFPKGLQLFDIAALQEIYGRNFSERNTETVYSKTDAFSSGRVDASFVYTIWDGGDTDVIYAADYDTAAQIDLRQGRFSSIGYNGNFSAVAFDSGSYDAGNVAISYFTVIENATGTNDELNGDTLIGNAWDNVLRGLDGDDFLYGDGIGYDDQTGFLGVDDGNGGFHDPQRAWGVGNPIYAANLSGNDKLYGGAGDDHIYGGAGSDTYFYSLGDNHDNWYEDDWTAENSIRFGAGIDLSSLQISFDDDKGILTFSDGGTVTLHNFFDTTNPSNLILDFEDGPRVLRAVDESYTGSEIVGTYSADVIYGNASGNVIFTVENLLGGAEGDIVFAGAGDDEIYSQNFDTVFAGSGNDTIISQYGDNSLFDGEEGNDIIIAGEGDSEIYGGSGNDTLYGGVDTDEEYELGSDIIHGGDGDDYIWGGWSDEDVLYGDDGNDILILWPAQTGYGGSGNDTLRMEYRDTFAFGNHLSVFASGDDGNDIYEVGNNQWLFQWTREVVIEDSSGEDYLSIDFNQNIMSNILIDNYDLVLTFAAGNPLAGPSQSSIRIVNFLAEDVDNKVEWIQFSDTPNGDYLDLKSLVASFIPYTTLNGTSAGEELSGNFLVNRIYGREGTDTLYGYDGDDILRGDAGNDTAYGGNGNDTIYGDDSARDALFVGAGADTLFGGDGADRIFGGAGSDLIYGDDGDDDLSGDGGEDIINGGVGADILRGYEGSDDLNGDDGDDIIYGDDSARDPLFLNAGDDTLRGGAGLDRIYGGAGSDLIYGDDGNDNLNGDAGIDIIRGGLGNDVLRGGEGSDSLWGEEGDDDLSGDSGSDAINGGDGADILRGHEGSDDLNGGDGDDTLFGDDTARSPLFVGAGNDVLRGGAGIDRIYGGAGSDLIYGDDGNDIVFGDSGDDTIRGGLGDDTLRGGEDNDTIWGGDGADRLYGDFGGDLLRGEDGNDIIYGGGQNDSIYGGNGNDNLNGDEGDDTLYGEDGDDILRGGGDADQDTLYGGAGNDRLYGGGYFDSLYGEDGDDFLYGDDFGGELDFLYGNSDYLSGGAGNDRLYGYFRDDILEGDDGEDRLYGGEGNDELFGGNDRDYLYGETGDDSLFGDEGDDILYGGEGDDYLNGGNGDDVLNGDEGSDSLIGDYGDDTLRGGAGGDYLEGGDGADRLYGGADGDYLIGGLGVDNLYGEGDADTFFFNRDGYEAGVMDIVRDFSVAEGDTLNIADIIDYYSGFGHDLNDFVQLQSVGGGLHTRIRVDIDGQDGQHTWSNLIQLQDVTGLNLNDLVNNGNLIAE